MAYQLFLYPRAQRELDEAPAGDFEKIDQAIWALKENPRPFGVKKLEGHVHRIRIGSWRVIYAILDQDQKIVILKVSRRHERTYKNF